MATRFPCRIVPCLLALTAIGAAGRALAAASGDVDLAAVRAQLAEMQAAVTALQRENAALRERQGEMERRVAQLAAVSAAGTAPAGPLPEIVSPPAAERDALRLWGYGEIYYTYPTHVPQLAEADLARAVFGLGYRFDARTEFNSEYEVEHAVSSASDVGEFEVEQFYIDRQLTDTLGVRAGLFLMPFGLLNEHHEPVNFYGVQRNFVETLIIPSTWREGGVNLHGDSGAGLGWSAGLTTGFNLSRWDFAPHSPPYATALDLEDSGTAPLQASHQELALARAQNLSEYLALGYYGLPGLLVGGAISSGEAVRTISPAGSSPAGAQRVTLWEAHARWTPGPFELSSVYARGSIGNLAAANAAYPGASNPVPSVFDGYFVQGAWSAWQQGDYRAAPFVRWEHYELGAAYAGTAGPVTPAGPLPLTQFPGVTAPWPANHDRVWTAGANFYIGAHLVLKADYQWFRVNEDFSRFDLGLGVSF